MNDQLDVQLEDADLLAEVELTTSLIVAASSAEGPLDQREIDAILGVTTATNFPQQAGATRD